MLGAQIVIVMKKTTKKKLTTKKPGDGNMGETHRKVQLWKDGPYWATTNIGADTPEDSGYYFWWGDTVGYKRENDKWVAAYRESSEFLFESDNTPTFDKYFFTLQSEEWITPEYALAPEHDAAHVQWGGKWRLPTMEELRELKDKCDWTWKTVKGVGGYVVRGRAAYASASIFLPASGYGVGTSLLSVGSYGSYWSSVPRADRSYAWILYFRSDEHSIIDDFRNRGRAVRPVQGVAQ